MDSLQSALADNLERLAKQVRQGTVKSVFAVAIGPDGPDQAILVEPQERESIIIAINDETTRMLGSPHHLVCTDKLAEFLSQHNITEFDLLLFQINREREEGH